MDCKIFPPLYGVDKNNKIKEWNIRVDNFNSHSILTYSYGYINGRKVECKLTINKGKNIGKTNQTSHFQQAILDAQSRWNKKHEIEKYSTDLLQIQNSLNNINKQNSKSPTLLPMLAQDLKKNIKHIKFPCFIQPKLDGYRMIYNPITKTFTSRTGKPFNVINSSRLAKELSDLQIDVSLDGELYVHDTSFAFENYGVLRKLPSKLTIEDYTVLSKIKYHVYDIIDTSKTFSERLELLKSLPSSTHIEIVTTLQCDNQTDIELYHKRFTEENYEGSIIRNSTGLYKQKYRSNDLLKYKDFDDNEFTIVNFTYEKDTSGKNEKPIIWICQTENGLTFNVTSKGTKTERTELYNIGNSYIGKKLWVQHFGWTNDGIPRFPKTMRNGKTSIRNFE